MPSAPSNLSPDLLSNLWEQKRSILVGFLLGESFRGGGGGATQISRTVFENSVLRPVFLRQKHVKNASRMQKGRPNLSVGDSIYVGNSFTIKLNLQLDIIKNVLTFKAKLKGAF